MALELRIARRAWEWDDIADVLHACDEEDETLETESEACVWTGAEATSVEVPPHVLHGDVALVNLVHELGIVFLTHGTAYYLAYLREEDIGALHGLLHRAAFEGRHGVVNLHIEGLYLLGIVGHDDGLAEVLLHEIAFVLAGEVVTPLARELELLLSRADSFLQYLNALGVGEAHEGLCEHALQTGEESLVDHAVEELKVVAAIVESPAHAVLDEVLLEVHEVVEVHKSHLGFYHPELGKVAGRVAVFGTEGGTEGVDGTESSGTELALELSAYGEGGLLAEEVVVVDDAAVLVHAEVVEVLSGDLKHLARPFAVAGCDEGSVEVEVSVLVEVGVYGHRHVVTDAHDGSEGVSAQTQVGMLAHIFEALSLLLHGIVGVACAKDLNLGRLHLARLTCGRTLHEGALDGEAGSRSDEAEEFGGELCGVADHLYVLYGAAVVEGDEEDVLALALGAYPAHDGDGHSVGGAAECFNYFCSLYHKKSVLKRFLHYSKAPMRSIDTSFSVRKRQSPRLTFFLVSPAK